MRDLVITKDVLYGGKWLQRTTVNGKYTWTESGVVWNGIKRRTTQSYTLQRTNEANYAGAKNEFTDFDDFVKWVRCQVGYGLRYDLDADILKSGDVKVYSKQTCLLLPPQLNRFLQDIPESNTGFRGVSKVKNSFVARCMLKNECSDGYDIYCVKHVKTLQEAKDIYTDIKNKAAGVWRSRLKSGNYCVDRRVIDYMNQWEFKYD